MYKNPWQVGALFVLFSLLIAGCSPAGDAQTPNPEPATSSPSGQSASTPSKPDPTPTSTPTPVVVPPEAVNPGKTPTPVPAAATATPTRTSIVLPTPGPEASTVKVVALLCWLNVPETPATSSVAGVYLLRNDGQTTASILLDNGASWMLGPAEARAFGLAAASGSDCAVSLTLPTGLYPNGDRGPIYPKAFRIAGVFTTFPHGEAQERAQAFYEALARRDEAALAAMSCCQDVSTAARDLIQLIAHRRTLNKVERITCGPRFGEASLPTAQTPTPSTWICAYEATYVAGTNLADSIKVNLAVQVPDSGGNAVALLGQAAR